MKLKETLCIKPTWTECPKVKATKESHLVCTYKSHCQYQRPERPFNRKVKWS
jgi:hypothetical protein